MISAVRAAREADASSEYYTAGTARILSVFADWRFLYFHGQRHARLVQYQSVYSKPKRERTLLIKLLSPLLFLEPKVYLREMEKLWTDEVVSEIVWRKFISSQLEGWKDLILTSTVMLSANVGFLAIPGVVISNLGGSGITTVGQVVVLASPAQMASSLSIVTSVASIVTGLLLIRFNRTKQEEIVSDVSVYLRENSRGRLGFEPTAIIFSLPWALLLWSMVIFFVALLLQCLYISNLSTRILVGMMAGVVAAFIAGCIRITWDSSRDGSPDGRTGLARKLARVVARIKHVMHSPCRMYCTYCMSHPPSPEDVGSIHSMTDRGLPLGPDDVGV